MSDLNLSPSIDNDFFKNKTVEFLEPNTTYDINDTEHCSNPNHSTIFEVGLETKKTESCVVKKVCVRDLLINLTYLDTCSDKTIHFKTAVIEFVTDGKSNCHIFRGSMVKIRSIVTNGKTYVVSYA